jgi:hypothetical protein
VLTSWTWHFYAHCVCIMIQIATLAPYWGRTSSRLPLEHQFATRLVPFSCHHGYII